MWRKRINLNGTWDFVADLDPKYHQNPSYVLPETDRRHWRKVPVPGVWNLYDRRYDIFEGVCYFAKLFSLSKVSKANRYVLRFDAVNYLADIYVNGEKAGSHEGGYTPFAIDISGLIRKGKNLLAIRVDNRATIIKFPPCLGYFNYGGIHRNVSLEILQGPSLEKITVTSTLTKENGKLKIAGKIFSSQPGMNVKITCNRLSENLRVKKNGSFSGVISVPGIEPWSPENPRNYSVRIEITQGGKVLDYQKVTTGFRTIAMKDGKILLNGEDFPLKGICYVYDSPKYGLVMNKKQVTRDLDLMKQAGVNCVRCHYPMDETFYDACDRIGMMVWIEPPVYCLHPKDSEKNTPFANPDWLKLAKQMATEMISQARNHPSVIIYSVGNECNTGHPEAYPFFKSLANCIRRNDNSRLLSYAALYGLVGPIADLVDILGINSYWGWYDKIWGGKGLEPGQKHKKKKNEPIDLTKMEKMLNYVLANRQNLALLLTEFGADSVPGLHSSQRALWSEDYHKDLLVEIFSLAKRYPQIQGTFPFCFSDYRDPSKQLNAFWDEFNYKGIVDYHRNKKLPFKTLMDEYSHGKGS